MTQHSPASPPEPGEITDPEEFEEGAPIDPTPQQVDEYQKLVDENAPERQVDPDL